MNIKISHLQQRPLQTWGMLKYQFTDSSVLNVLGKMPSGVLIHFYLYLEESVNYVFSAEPIKGAT